MNSKCKVVALKVQCKQKSVSLMPMGMCQQRDTSSTVMLHKVTLLLLII